ncbi:peptidoglycan DD-metalloendopeptidase family protein [Oscillospiraceae bacterium OttesenSCG-928-F05]|nr:peptidoglycan DD-metalloendopeptidase family protein [Oscillospiraceae bacterium OttesenSCG-928-F05]
MITLPGHLPGTARPAPALPEDSGEKASRALRRGWMLAVVRARGTAAKRGMARFLLRAYSAADRAAPLWLRRVFSFLWAAAVLAGDALGETLGKAGHSVSGVPHAALDRAGRFHPARAAAAIFLAVSVVGILSSSLVGVGLAVYLNGEQIGFVSRQADFESMLSSVEYKASQILGYPYDLNVDVAYEFDMFSRNEMIDLPAAEAVLFAEIEEIKPLYVLSIEGEAIGATADGASIENVLEAMLASHATGYEKETLEFLRDISVRRQYTDASKEQPATEIISTLLSNVREEQRTEILPGDTAAAIAARHGISEDLLADLNPETNFEKLIAGESLVVTEARPLMSVKVTREEYYDVAIPFETEFVNDDTLFIGQTRKKVEGVEGTKAITASISYVDGREVEHTVLNETIMAEPTTEVVRVGTRKRQATGSFVKPFNGSVSSPYGYRRFRGRTEFHTGVDLTGPAARGKPIVASDGGTVSYAGWKGSYGNLVIIDHGNGYSTYYAHCQSLNVSAGQKVAQGELIARVGSTGNSTGPHLHFEVRVGGQHKNPMNYIGRTVYEQ